MRVYVVKNGHLEERLVQLLDASGDRAGILRGIAPGEKVVAKAGPELRDGVSVQ
jgi:membrane fusion protein (multidrug efflux system)